ncbi:MAG: RNA-binding S4 domain-containing protein [Ignavibacteria bacterium]
MREEHQDLRIDKYLWAVRIFKSRTTATEACNGNKIKIDGTSVKPSHHIKQGEIFTVQSGYLKKTYKVIELLSRRLSAKFVSKYVQDITPQEELLKTEIAHRSYIQRFKGAGRPTKKERRLLDKIRI